MIRALIDLLTSRLPDALGQRIDYAGRWADVTGGEDE